MEVDTHMNADAMYRPQHAPPTVAAATWSAARAIAWRHLYKWISLPQNFMPTFLFPLLFFVGFSGSLGAVEQVRGFDYEPGYTSFIFVFSLLQTCTFGGLATGFTIAGDFETGFAQRLMLCTQSRLAILLGYMFSTFVRAALMCGVVTAVAFVAGLRMLGSPRDIVALYAIALTMSFIGTLWASGVMFRGRSAQVAPAMQMPMFITLFLAPVFVPFELLQGWIHAVARFNPITYVMEAERSLLAGEGGHVVVALLSIAAMLLVFGAWAVTGLRRAERAG